MKRTLIGGIFAERLSYRCDHGLNLERPPKLLALADELIAKAKTATHFVVASE
jgi:hypothetical protein